MAMIGGNNEEAAAKVPAWVRTARFVYGLLAAAYFLCIVLQVFYAGLGIFADAEKLQLHRVFANYFESVSLLLFLISFLGRIRGSLRWLPLALLALTSLQHMTIRTFTGSLTALHTVDALLLFWISLHLLNKSWHWLMRLPDESDTKPVA